MTDLVFDRARGTLSILPADGRVRIFPAANNADRRSLGPWPAGVWHFAYWNLHPGDGADSAYGSHGIFIFDVPGREGLGVHSGRLGRTDLAGRTGVNYATLGCIRTVDEATAELLALHEADPITAITVG